MKGEILLKDNFNVPYPIENMEEIKLKTINADELLKIDFPPLAFAINEILPQGIFILAGSGKIGKSWLSLDMCLTVASGSSLWEYSAEKGDVLYLALEDNYRRLQTRLTRIKETKNSIKNLHLATASQGICDGLIEQIKAFINANPNTKLVVIDTLEKIRNSMEFSSSMYQTDYKDMTKLREVTDSSNVTLLLIHHSRKMYDPDPLNTLTGSTGLVGSVDGVWVLEKETRVEDRAKLTVVNRDTQEYCFNLTFEKENCKWLFLGHHEKEETPEEVMCALIDKFLDQTFTGTATQLCNALKQLDGSLDISNLTITKKLKSIKPSLKLKYNIDVEFGARIGNNRVITLSRSL